MVDRENSTEREKTPSAHEFHVMAEIAREQGRFIDALKHTDEAMVGYSTEDNKAGVAEVLASRFLTLRHLFESSGDRSFLINAVHTVSASVEIARESDDPRALTLPLFNAGKAYESVGNYEEASRVYGDAIQNYENNPPEIDRPAQLADFQARKAICDIRLGDDSGLERAVSALEDLANTDEKDLYAKDVWLSGGYMRLADVLRDSDHGSALAYMRKAENIIEANPDLELMKKQWEKLNSSLTSSE